MTAGNPEKTLKQHILPVRFTGYWLKSARLIWVFLAFIMLGVIFTSLPGYIGKIRAGVPGHGPQVSPSDGYVYFQALNSLISLISSLLSFYLAALLFRRKFDNPAVAAISFYLLLYSVVMTGPLEAWGMHWLGDNDFVIRLQTVLMGAPTIALLALFPNGRFVPGWTRWLLAIAFPINLVWLLLPVFPLDMQNWAGVSVLAALWIAQIGLGAYAQVYRYRFVSNPEEQRQTRWVLYGFSLWVSYMLLSSIPFFYLTSLPSDAALPWWSSISELTWWLSLNILPVTFVIAITRSRLWGIDIIINRTLVYGALTAATMALYVLVVSAVGTLLNNVNSTYSTYIAFLTTGFIALIFQPLRQRLQNWVNRIMYGERDDPVSVLSRLSAELKKTGSPQDALSSITKTVAIALKLPYVAIELGEGQFIAAAYGIPGKSLFRLPMVYQNEIIGYLVVAFRSPGEAYTHSEKKLLENIAQHAGATAHAARLTTDLRVSRQRLVTTREEERRRIRRDLHDGLGPQLASQLLMLEAARRLIKENPQKAAELLKEAIVHAQTATDDVRRLVYGLRPPALDDLGLMDAMRVQIQRIESNGIKFRVNFPESLPALPAAVEVACFMIFQEALANVHRHAQATQCWIWLHVNRGLELIVADNGVGIKPQGQSGVGLRSMRQRAEELGGRFQIGFNAEGGTRLTAWLPLEVEI